MAISYRTYREKALRIIDDNDYMVISTCDLDNTPWSAAVFYAYDDKYNFYFISAIDSLHAKHIKKNPKVSFIIFDSLQQIGDSDSVQAEGKAIIVPDSDVKEAIQVYSKRLARKSGGEGMSDYDPKGYSGASEFRFFKITLSRLFTTGEERRVEIDLKE